MGGLTIGDIIDVVRDLTDSGMGITEVRKIKIIIGDDEELNGVHHAFFAQLVEFRKHDEEADEFKGIFEECGIRTDISSLLIS